ncbi:DUF58 domain-containing protein [Natrarchaeobius halalkaliphilus]|uniref:DUF58 domain-containing protein n=1 Tax=Natrarchaeobius halalkaliphilus TaxID=1679091 RepID=A0A3N6LP36_9EURY|nr:DUF58 domain-containing protein [Natrarchaeobius halalkaliphilus]RQG91183.1 DUF58 domain-containing protein [Natrarchaeobius halalkaliphilus]
MTESDLDSGIRPVPILVAVASFVTAIAILTGTGTLTVTQAVVSLVGFASLCGALVSLSRRRDARTCQRTPDPERPHPTPVPGDSLTDAIEEFTATRSHGTFVARRTVGGLRQAAIAVISRFGGASEAEARAAVDDGSWTTDPIAAAFLSEELDRPSRSVREHVVDRVRGDDPYHLAIRRTGAEIASIGYTGLDERNVPETARLHGHERSSSDDTVDVRTTERRLADGEADGIPARATGHWTGIGVVALAAIGIGAVAEASAVVLAGVVGIGYAGFALTARPPTPTLEIERTVSDDAPEPEDEVDVTVSITNVGERPLLDLRVVDGVPAALSVTDGSARLATALRPGERATLEYTVTAACGTHEFDPALVVTRDPSRSAEKAFYVGASTTLVCEPLLRPIESPVPLQAASTTFSGRLTTATGGSGTEFHSVRDYRRNDPLNRIDWNRHARTGELATIEFHQERAARVVVLVDAREAAYLASSTGSTHAVSRATDAASRIAGTLLESGDTVGLAAIGPTSRPVDGADDSGDADVCWIPPSSGNRHRIRLREALATHPQFSPVPPEREARWITQLRALRRRLAAETQIVFLTPLCDRGSVVIARRLASHGHALTVVSPNPTAERTTGQQLSRVARRIRQFDLERAGISVTDWNEAESIDELFARRAAATRGGRR